MMCMHAGQTLPAVWRCAGPTKLLLQPQSSQPDWCECKCQVVPQCVQQQPLAPLSHHARIAAQAVLATGEAMAAQAAAASRLNTACFSDAA